MELRTLERFHEVMAYEDVVSSASVAGTDVSPICITYLSVDGGLGVLDV
jgi:hypothetical protein